ncbi:MAG: hypothetical protein CMN73_10350 [Sphingomonas sp.]|nr:hypothetical protein [Sphingomonas sp.]
MDRRQAMVGALAAGTLLPLGAGAMIGGDAMERVRTLVDRYAAAWNGSDMDAMAALYTDDVHWVNIVGMHWQGKAQVDLAHRIFFDIMFHGVPLTLEEIESVTPLAGGAIVAVVRWAVGAFTTPAGQQRPPSRDRMSLVLVPRGDALAIAHGANIEIDEMAQQSDPIARSAG